MVVKTLLVLTSLFAIYANVFSLMPPIVLRGVFWGFIAMVVFWPSAEAPEKRREPHLDIFLAVLVALCTAILVFRWEEFASGIHDPTSLEIAAAVVMVFLILEATRRKIGWFLVGITILFILYGLFGNYAPTMFATRGYSVTRLSSFLFWDTTGIYGLPMYIAASYVMLFVIFGAFLLKTGGEKWFMDLSFAAVGRIRGGPALTSVMSSAFFGMMSGSPVANVVTTGSFTIPLMKQIGFKKHIAAAIEAVASTAGMFTPPIMGAGAFIMAEYVEMPYISVAIAAAVPAFLFYVSLMSTVYLRAVKTDIPALSKAQIPDLFITLKNYGHLIPPVLILIGLLLSGWSLMWAAFWSIISLVALAMLRKLTRMTITDILEALADATEKAIPVAVACAAAGIIYGIISLTGLGFRVSSELLTLAGGGRFLVLLFSMLSGILLGFAMPPTAAYIILAALIVPSLTEVGLSPLVAHMFLFMFCCIGPITPPVALAAYSASGLAGSDPTKTGFAAFRMGFAAFVIPFLFAYSPQLLLIGEPLAIIGSGLTTMIGLIFFVIAIEGYLIKKLNWLTRTVLLLVVVAIFLCQSLL
ncbi:MAG: TRAP transporter fused permease subunit [Desulfobacteraceae bacterium]|nr:MAG: TRAP transporter fused permease subunit [Desulfobacteraceae bacterium]